MSRNVRANIPARTIRRGDGGQNVKQIVVVYLSALRPPNTHKKCGGRRRSQFNFAAHFMLIRNMRYITHFTRLIVILNLESTVLPYYFRPNDKLVSTWRHREVSHRRCRLQRRKESITELVSRVTRHTITPDKYNMAKSTRAENKK